MRSSLSRYIILAKRWAWVIILGVVICGGITFVVTKLMPKVYTAESTLLITVVGSTPYESAQTAILEQPQLNPLIKSEGVLAPVAARHGLTTKQLSDMVTTKPQSNSATILVDVDNADPKLAALLAYEVGQSFSQYVQNQLGGSTLVTALRGPIPLDASKPRPTQDALLGALVGLGLALAIIIIFEWIDDRLTSPEEANTLLGLEVLTVIPELSSKQRTKNAEDTPELAEGCRVLCASLNMAQMVRPFKLVMITSALANEGKSTIAANVASFLAMSGKRVLLVDADLRHPVLDQHFQLNNQKGLSSAFLEMWAKVELELDGQPTEIPSLRVLTAGVLPSNPSELLQSQLAGQLFNHFRNTQKFDYVIFDAPPVLPVADAQIMASYIQVTILVIDASNTARKAMIRAKQTLSRTGTRILGVALNKSRWPEYGNVHDYLNNVQQRPRADITMSMPPNTPPINRMDAPNNAIYPSANNKR